MLIQDPTQIPSAVELSPSHQLPFMTYSVTQQAEWVSQNGYVSFRFIPAEAERFSKLYGIAAANQERTAALAKSSEALTQLETPPDQATEEAFNAYLPAPVTDAKPTDSVSENSKPGQSLFGGIPLGAEYQAFNYEAGSGSLSGNRVEMMDIELPNQNVLGMSPGFIMLVNTGYTLTSADLAGKLLNT